MAAIRRILVAVKDPSARSLPAVAKGAQLAAALGASLELFHDLTATMYVGFPGGIAPDVRQFEREHRSARLEQLERVAAPLRRRGLQVSVVTEWDYPAHDAVVRRAIKTKADLIVAEHHHGRHHMTWLLSFSDWELLRLSPVPVLLVKSRKPYRRPVVLAAVDPLHAFAKPAALDARILRLGATVTQALHGKLHAVHAHAGIPERMVPTVVADASVAAQFERQAAVAARAAFDRVLRSTDIAGSHRHLVAGEPASAIEGVARRTGSAIVVLGVLSRSGIRRLFIGDTAERLLDELRSDLLVVKAPDFTVRVPRAQRGVRVVSSPVPMP